jgi:arylsulfatase A-like enzyme
VPNIVFILADDIGYGDFACYGATRVKTPNVDRVAREGVRFTDAHATGSVCTPTRYAFITGQYAWRNPAGASILSGEAPLTIDPTKPTTASVLRAAGYTTGIVGKWHMGLGKGDLDFNRDIKPGPLEVGFDYAFFFPATGDRVPCVFIENHRVVGLDPRDPIQVSYSHKVGDDPTGREHPEMLKLMYAHGHDATIINGISRIGWMSGGKAARWKDEDIADTLTQKAVGFIERSKDRPFFLYFATHDIHVPRWPHDRFRGTSGCGTRGDAIQQFDACVGAVLTTLERLKLADNTLVIVTSDNGGVLDDGYLSHDAEQANGHQCNGVLRGFKGSLWEGGHREPFVARWPGRIKPGTQSAELIGLVDMLATFSAVAGRDVPADGGPDSFNVLPAILGGKSPRDHLVVQTNGTEHLAIRQGAWKYIPASRAGARKAAKKGGGKAELYNLADDLSETTNLIGEHPDVAARLSELLKTVVAGPGSRK